MTSAISRRMASALTGILLMFLALPGLLVFLGYLLA